jgi:hypothetical protein
VTSPSAPPESANLRALARLLDEAIPIPGTRFRIGLDALLGLFPGLGDLGGGLFAAVILVHAGRRGAPPSVLARMVANVATDTLLGAVPVVGDLFDAGWKANTRNVRLLDRYLERPGATRASSRAVVLGLIALLALIIVGAVALAIWVIGALINAAS